MIKKQFSQTQGALKKGYTGNNPYESFPTVQTMVDVADESADGVLGQTSFEAASIVTVSGSSITDPDHYRALSVTAGISDLVVAITGYDRGGRVVTDMITTVSGATVDGLVPMASISKIVAPAAGVSGVIFAVGTSNKLGLYRPIESTADVVMAERKATAATEFTIESAVGTVNAIYGTVVPSGGITDDDTFRFAYETKQF